MEPFHVRDCALIVRMGGERDAVNLRELRERVASCPSECLYHHFCETPLRATFDDPEHRNDFAVWAHRALHDRPLAERLGILDPYEFDGMEALRAAVLDILDDRLSEISHVPWAHRGNEFHFMRAVTIVFDTGRFLSTAADLALALSEITPSSLYYHFIEARRRTPGRTDDFSAWLRTGDEQAHALADAVGAVDFYFLTLPELQRELVRVAYRCLTPEAVR